MADIPEQTITVVKGSDWTRYVRVFDGAQIVLSADAAAAAVSLTLAPDHPAIASGDKLLFGENIILTTSGACAAGATSVGVTAIPGPLKAKAVGRRIVKDLSTYTLEFRMLAQRGDTASVFDITPTVGDDATDPNSPKADIAQVVGDEDDTKDETPGSYFWALWNTVESAEKVIAQGPFEIVEAGYQT
jgi:hypothetical protein